MNLETFVANGQAAQAAADQAIKQSVNSTPLLCRSKVRELLLDLSKQFRPFNKFNRVSEETLIAANEALRAWAVGHVKRMPSKGKTL